MKSFHEQLQELKDTSSFISDTMLVMIQSDDEHSDSTILGLINSLRALDSKFDELLGHTEITPTIALEGEKVTVN